MLRSVSCLIFILTHSVLAQASPEANQEPAANLRWVATFSGETEIDGLPVIAQVEMASPSLTPVITKAYRLNLMVAHHREIRATYPIAPRPMALEGMLGHAFVSAAHDPRGFQFLVSSPIQGKVRVNYIRRGSEGKTLTGEFFLSPVPSI